MSPVVAVVLRAAASAVIATYITPPIINRISSGPLLDDADHRRDLMLGVGIQGVTTGLLFVLLQSAFGGPSVQQGVSGGGGAT